jgi:hypothetical protein
MFYQSRAIASWPNNARRNISNFDEVKLLSSYAGNKLCNVMRWLSMLNISLPEQVKAFVEEQAKAAGYDSTNEYVYQLIVREQERVSQQHHDIHPLDENEPKASVLADLQQALKDGAKGQTYPISDLWME